MDYGIYTIYDRKAGIYGNIFLSLNDSCAIRDFETVAKRLPYPDDMELYRVGAFNSESGKITGENVTFVVAMSSIIGAAAQVSE